MIQQVICFVSGIVFIGLAIYHYRIPGASITTLFFSILGLISILNLLWPGLPGLCRFFTQVTTFLVRRSWVALFHFYGCKIVLYSRLICHHNQQGGQGGRMGKKREVRWKGPGIYIMVRTPEGIELWTRHRSLNSRSTPDEKIAITRTFTKKFESDMFANSTNWNVGTA